MIKINLAKKKQSGGAGGGGFSAALSGGKSLFSGGGDLSALKGVSLSPESLKALMQNVRVGQFIIPALIAGGAWYGEGYYKDAQLQVVDAKLADVQAEKKQLEASVSKLKNYEEMKKSLESDELVMRTKIEAIRKLISERGSPIKTLVALSNALPSEVWLSDIDVKENEVELLGYALKFEQISDFMKSLGENDLFTDINLRNTQVNKDETGMSMPSFEVVFKRKQRQGAGS